MIGKLHTTVRTNNGITTVQLHDTNVATFNEKEITLNTGGFFTNTTKRRMNQAAQTFNLGFMVYVKDFQWFAEYKGKTFSFNDGNVLTILR